MILACGSRGFTDRERIRAVLERYPPGALLLHGGARGADTIAGEEATKLGLHVEVMYADWERHGRSAGYKRNLAMLDRDPEIVIAFWDGSSRGTAHTIREARKRGIPVEVVR